MKSILDPTFRYTSSVATDVRRTFERVRREMGVLSRAAGQTPTYCCSTCGAAASASESPLHAIRPFSTMK